MDRYVREVLALLHEDSQSNAAVWWLILTGFDQVEAASSHLIKTISARMDEKRPVESLEASHESSSEIELF